MADGTTSPVDALLSLVQAQLLEMNVCLPGTIVNYSDGRATVKPTLTKRYADGTALPYPTIYSARVVWPSFAGGSAGVKGPVLAGDPCLLVFAQHALDGSDDLRHSDLNDCFVIPCDLGNVRGQASDNGSMQVYYGEAFVKLSADGKVTVNAPGGFTLTASEAQVTAATTLMTTQLTVNGTETVTGLLTGAAGLAISGGAGAVVSGNLTHTGGAITSDGVNIGATHIHPDPHGGFTGPPQ